MSKLLKVLDYVEKEHAFARALIDAKRKRMEEQPMATYHCPTCICNEPVKPRDAGDYYREKREDAKLAQAALDLHRQLCSTEAWACRTCRILDKRLELARYTGD